LIDRSLNQFQQFRLDVTWQFVMREAFDEARQINNPDNLSPVFGKIPTVLDEST
jgi:hypothetical protein